jgi:hypothetical protein
MAVTTLEAATAMQRPSEHRAGGRCSLPVKVLGTVNAILAGLVLTGVAAPEMLPDVYDMLGLPATAFLRTLDLREPAYMAFALVWIIAVIYMHVDEINESRLALRSVPESEIIRAYTIEDLIGHFVRAALILLPSCGLYLLPHYLHKASQVDHATFVLMFVIEFFLWRCLRRD